MFRVSQFGAFALALSATFAISAALQPVDAKRKPKPPLCQPALEGSATSTGPFGAGTALAREAAQAEWVQRAERFYGPKYANWSNARGARWDCKAGAILLAKCAVVARPCRG
jgi:hypothetical protein